MAVPANNGLKVRGEPQGLEYSLGGAQGFICQDTERKRGQAFEDLGHPGVEGAAICAMLNVVGKEGVEDLIVNYAFLAGADGPLDQLSSPISHKLNNDFNRMPGKPRFAKGVVHAAGEVIPGFYKGAVEVKNDQPAFSIHGLFRTIRFGKEVATDGEEAPVNLPLLYLLSIKASYILRNWWILYANIAINHLERSGQGL